MLIINTTNNPINKEKCIALGNFDGVHLGHRCIINSCISYACANTLKSCVYTFSRHSSHSLGIPKPLLTTAEEKNKLIGYLGCDYIYEDDFDKIKNMSAEEFCKSVLIKQLNAKAVFCGENYRFGRNASGDVALLKNILKQYEVPVFVQPYVEYNGVIVCSTAIRNALASGDIRNANAMLGSNYTLTGTVIHGKKMGKLLGFPTLNIDIPVGKLVPFFGVYISACLLDGKWYKAVTNIGKRPTTDSETEARDYINCETHLMNYCGDSYGKIITVELIDLLRSEKKFSSADELKKQIASDSAAANNYFDKFNLELI